MTTGSPCTLAAMMSASSLLVQGDAVCHLLWRLSGFHLTLAKWTPFGFVCFDGNHHAVRRRTIPVNSPAKSVTRRLLRSLLCHCPNARKCRCCRPLRVDLVLSLHIEKAPIIVCPSPQWTGQTWLNSNSTFAYSSIEYYTVHHLNDFLPVSMPYAASNAASMLSLRMGSCLRYVRCDAEV